MATCATGSERLLDKAQARHLFADTIADADVHLVGADLAYDLGMMAADNPPLIAPIFEALDPGRLHCVQNRTKYDRTKNRVELVPVRPPEEIALAFTYGAQKYEPDNYRRGTNWRRYVGAALRHTLALLAARMSIPRPGSRTWHTPLLA